MAVLIEEQPSPGCDLMFVFAGIMERKSWGLELLSQRLAPRLILSVGRFEVRQTTQLLAEPELIAMRDRTPADQRHFWIDYDDGGRSISPARLKRSGTFEELLALSDYLQDRPPQRMALISTSFHLQRIGFCCLRNRFFAEREIRLWPVPEEMSSFKKAGWWKRPSHWLYRISEQVKLAGYGLIYR